MMLPLYMENNNPVPTIIPNQGCIIYIYALSNTEKLQHAVERSPLHSELQYYLR